MDEVGISLGWNCSGAVNALNNGLRGCKRDGYMTCPFDECISNYKGICQCIEEDFKYFFDEKYLKVINAPNTFSMKNVNGIYEVCLPEDNPDLHVTKDQLYIYNTRYHFMFTHESPGTCVLHRTQNWKNGIMHYIENDFFYFKERYQRRIDNFRHYLNGSNKINFVMTKWNNNLEELNRIITKLYPNVLYTINIFRINFSKDALKGHLLLTYMDEEDIDKELQGNLLINPQMDYFIYNSLKND